MRRWLTLVMSFCAVNAIAAIPSSQRDALISIYNSTAGASWKNNAGWLGAPGTECSWYGVQCDDAQANATQLNLYDNNLRGPLPPALRDLTGLQELVLFDNEISGPIPPEIGQLANLEILYLDRTKVSGSIPPAMGSLAKLRVLAMSGTSLTGPIPRELGNLSSLQELGLGDNALSGTLPPELGQLANLTAFDASRNRVSGPIPKELGNLAKLESLTITESSLSGGIPPELGRLASLRILRLSYNRLEGTIPAEIGGLRNLQQLDLAYNKLAGVVPAAIGDLASLQQLELSNNAFEGPFPSDVLRLSQLQGLHLGANRFSGEIPRAIGGLSNLNALSLYANQFTGTIPRETGSLRNLSSIELQNNQLTGSIPSEIGNLTQLTWIDMSANRLTGPLPAPLTALTNLRVLALYENQLEGTIPPDIGALTKLGLLLLSANRLTGPIPESIRNLHELTDLTLGGNELTGSIPAGVGELTKLERLYLSYNRLSGPIPPQTVDMRSLKSLNLDNNQFSGRIPNEIANLRLLEDLTLGFNELEGAIPPAIGQLGNLIMLSVEYNGLTGPLPRELGNLAKVVALDVSGNSLEGSLPQEIGNLTQLQYLSMLGNRFSGAIPREIGRLTALRNLDLSQNAFRGEIPAELKQLVNLEDGRSDLGYNVLLTSDASLRDFLTRKQYPDWERTQTITPRNLRVTQTTDRSATFEWDLIPYSGDAGGYQVVGTAAGSTTPSAVTTTATKDESSIVVRGLNPSRTYSFTISAVTHPHGFQQNLLVSDASAPVTLTTGPRVNAPAEIVVTEPTGGLVQIDGKPRNDDSFTLTNFGDATSAITIAKGDGDFYSIQPATFTLAGGASQVVTLKSLLKPFGTYYGYVDVQGDGTDGGMTVPVVLLSVTQPAGTVAAQALSTRIETAGAPGSDSVGVAKFKNVGTATLSGIVVADEPWLQPSTDPITIDPGQTASVNFRVVRSKRPTGIGALTANLSLVYVDGTAVGPLAETTPGISISIVTVVDVTKPPTAPGLPPATVPGEVAYFVPGVASLQRYGATYGTDVTILNTSDSRQLTDLRLYFTPAGATQSTVATMPAVASSQGVSLVSVLTNVYGATESTGSLQIRSTAWQSVAPFAKVIGMKPAGALMGALPVFRSDRGVPAGEAAYLTGLRTPGDVYVQEIGGNAASVRIDFLDENGAAAGSPVTQSLAPFGLAELRDAVPANAITAIITNIAGSTGRIAAYARVVDATSGDSWSIVDWSRVNRFSRREAVRAPFAQGRSGGTGRRRAVRHDAGTSSTTDLFVFNPGADPVRGKLRVIDASGTSSERDVTVASRATIVLRDVASPSNAANVIIEPARGELVVTGRTYRQAGGTLGTALPIVAASAGLRLGQSQVFSDLDDSTAATVAAATPATFRTSYGLVETSGQSVSVEASLVVSEAATKASAVLTRRFDLAPRQEVVLDELVRSLAGALRDTSFSNLHNLQLVIDVVGGNGSVIPFVIVTDNGSGDTMMRLE